MEKGFAQPLILLAALGVISVLTLSIIFTNQLNPQGGVKGVFIARENSDSPDAARTISLAPSPTQNKETEQETKDQEDKLKQEQESKDKEKETEKKLEKTDTKEVETKNQEKSLETESGEASGSSKESQGKREDVEIGTEGNDFKLQSQGQTALSNFPLYINQATGQLYVNTPQGAKMIRVLPPQAAAIATTAGVVNKIEGMEITNTSLPEATNEATVTVSGLKVGKMFGLIPVSVPVQTVIGANSGLVFQNIEPFWLKVLSPFIF
ncbi:MAG: hypothetical protein M1142_01790 [Patescibacteria group bacterium]|nr:hypothetical protein [Patescibacteria group bacterium]